MKAIIWQRQMQSLDIEMSGLSEGYAREISPHPKAINIMVLFYYRLPARIARDKFSVLRQIARIVLQRRASHRYVHQPRCWSYFFE